MNSQTVLETQRLTLRQFTMEDTDALLPILGNSETMVYYPHPFSRDEIEAFVRKQLTRYAESGHGKWAMLLKTTGELIGDCGLALQEVEASRYIEVGYNLHKNHWHNGYATEAARACIRYGFYKLHATQVISMIRPENRPSRRVAERNGMTAGKLVFWHGFNHLIYSISREEWFDAFREHKANAEESSAGSDGDVPFIVT